MSKKGGAKPQDEVTYDFRDVVLAKLRGYPPWPAQVVDPETANASVQKERPGGRKSVFHCVRFFPVGDYAWLPPKDLSKLKTHEIEAYINEPHKKNGELLKGYQIALHPEEWESQQQAKREAAEEAEADEEVDELEGEEADDDEAPVKAKKRKRDSEGVAKSKSKTKKDKEAGEAPAKKKKATEKADKPAKSRKNGNKSKEMVESEDEGERRDNAGPSKKASPPPAKKSKRDKEDDGDAELDNDPEAAKVKEMRHKLQRSFLGKVVPKDEDMPSLDALFTQVEESDMPIKYLQYSKIGKVMRHISALDKEKVPRDDEFKFKDRAQALVNKWHTTINSTVGKPNGSATSKGMDVDPPVVVNGDAVPPSAMSEAVVEKKEANGEEPKMEMDAEPAVEPAVGDTTFAESALGDVTMSEAAA